MSFLIRSSADRGQMATGVVFDQRRETLDLAVAANKNQGSSRDARDATRSPKWSFSLTAQLLHIHTQNAFQRLSRRVRVGRCWPIGP